jgi:protein-L-isoaspartate(D-aspartate) O-methyltransferase
MKRNSIFIILLIALLLLLSVGCGSPGRAENGPNSKTSFQASPLPGEMTLDDAISMRRSARQFDDKQLSREQLLALAWAGQGITEPNRGFRTAPSAGALYPVELYLVTPDAVYHYKPAENILEEHMTGDKRNVLAEAALGQKPITGAAVDIVITADVARTSVKYGDRAERYVLIEIGHVGQNILLKAVSSGLVSVPIGAFYDDKVASALELPDGHHPYYILSIGYPTEETIASMPVKEHSKPRFGERKKDRTEMVNTQMSGRWRTSVDDEKVLDAMRNVPRHMFVPDYLSGSAYDDSPLPIGNGQTISQPYIVAYMTEQLGLNPGDKVLEIGTGSGYQAAVLSEITQHVYTIEIIDKLADSAGKKLKDLGYSTIDVLSGDGYYGWEEHAPYDGIIVTCASGHIPPLLLDQLKPGGSMIIPIGSQFEIQRLVVVSKDKDGDTSTRDSIPVRFVPMTGRAEAG